MTQPPTTPGPDEPAGYPSLRPSAPGGPEDTQPPVYQPPAPIGAPPPVPQYLPDPAYDPAQSYVVYQAAPTYGYGVPAAGQQAGFDPMISPDYGGWWQRSFTIFKGAWKQLAVLQLIGFVLTLAVVIPEGIWSIKATADMLGSTGPEGIPSLTPLIAPFALLFVGAVVAGMVGSLITVAGNQIAVTVAAGQPPRLGPAFAVAVRRFLPLWGWQILAALMIGVGLCLCILPGIYVYAVFLILPAVVTFERGSSAISRCFQLFHKDFGSAIARIASIVGLAVAAGVVSYIVGRVIELAMGGSVTLNDPASTDVVLTSSLIATIVVSRIVTTLLETGMKMLTDVLTVTAYADMRARIEPLSTAQLAAEAGVQPAAASEWMAPPPGVA